MRTVKFDTQDGLFEGDLFLYMHNTEDLHNLIRQLSKLRGIDSVTRVENLNE
jgi:GTP pyrophosphokinase